MVLMIPAGSMEIVETRDEFCSQRNLESLARRLPPSSKVKRIQDADYFFSGQVEEVERLVEIFLEGLHPDRAMP
jgi:alpha/beta superfamily hydrolase